MKPRWRIFISYRAADTGFSPALLYETLSHHFGRKRVFRDVDDILPGEDYVKRLESAVRSSAVLLAIIGQQWLTATDPSGRRLLDSPHDWMRRELEIAFDARNVKVIPVFLEGAHKPTPADLPPSLVNLGRTQGLSLSQNAPSAELDRIVKEIKKSAPRLAVRNRRRAALVSVGGLAVVAGAVAFGATLFVNHQDSSNSGQSTRPGIESGATLPTTTTTSSGPIQAADVFWHGTVALDGEAADTNVSLDSKPPVGVAVGDIGLVCDVGCDPHKILGTLGRSSDSGPPDRAQCSNLVENPENPHLMDVHVGAYVCFKTVQNRLGYLLVTGISNSRLTFDVTVWEAS